MTEQALKDWLSKEDENKRKWLDRMYRLPNERKNAFQKEIMEQVYGKVMFIKEVLKQIRKVERKAGK